MIYIIKKSIHKFTCAILCIVLINAIPRSHAFALRPVAYKFSTVKSSVSGDLAGIPKDSLANPSSVSTAKKPKWAIEIAENLYENKRFDFGETYFEHANKVADTLIGLSPKIDELTIAAVLLHVTDIENLEKYIDTLKKHIENIKKKSKKSESKYKKDTISKIANLSEKDINKIVSLVKSMNRVSRLPYLPPDKPGLRLNQNKMNMIIQLTASQECMLSVFADKLKTLMAAPNLKNTQQDYIYREMLNIYAPLAERLGRNDLARDFRDTVLELSNREAYDAVVEAIQERIGMDHQKALEYLAEIEKKLKDDLKELNISARIETRLKSIYSVYEKIKSIRKKRYGNNGEVPIEEIATYIYEIGDLLGATIIVGNNEEDFWLASDIATKYDIDNREIKFDKKSGRHKTTALHAYVKNKAENMFYELQLITENNFYDRKYGTKAHWAYKANRETGQDFDMDDIEKAEDFNERFLKLKKYLDKWVFALREIDDTGGKTAFKVLRFFKGSISADFAAAKSLDALDKDYEKAKYHRAYYDIMQNRIIRSKKRELSRAAKLKSGIAVSILARDNFLKKNSNIYQAIKKHAEMPRTHLLLYTMGFTQVHMHKLAVQGKSILEEDVSRFLNIPYFKPGTKRLKKNMKKGYNNNNDFYDKIAKGLGLKDETELCVLLTVPDKIVVDKTKQQIKEYALRRRRDALTKGRELLRAGGNGLNLNDSKVLERLLLILNDPSIWARSFNQSIKIMSLQEFFIAIGNGKIDAEFVKAKLSAVGKRFRIQKPNICASAA